MTTLALASEFPASTREAWMAAAERVLKGADFTKTLVGRTYDGLPIEPLYPKADRNTGVAGRGATPWRVAGRIDHPDPVQANALALADLEGGADALTISFAGAASARGFGLDATTVDSLDAALAGVMLDLVSLAIEPAPFHGERSAALVRQLVERRGHRLAEIEVDFGLDPIGDLARVGELRAPWQDQVARLAETAVSLRDQGFRGAALRIDTRPYHEAGASEAQELAAALSSGVAYLRVLESGGMTLETAPSTLSFLLVADADEFLTVAKLRSFRALWARVEQACGLAPAPAQVHAETAWRMTTRRDPWVNLLRGTLAALSAGIGGANSVAVLPFTAALGLPDAFARRLARNTQMILLEECNLARVSDPVAGSGAFEALTDSLVNEAWKLFQEIEREGGIVESLVSGRLPGRIAVVRTERSNAVATRRNALTGSSEFPNIHETPVAVLLPAPVPERADLRPGLPSVRSAEPYERLRDRSDAILAQTGLRPRAFLANLGTIADFSVRATFAQNAVEACGIDAVGNDGFPDHGALVAAFSRSGTTTVCLCSSDSVYDAEAVSVAEALSAAGATRIYLAGRPSPARADDLRRASVTGFIFAGCDLPATLAGALEAQPA